MLRAFSPTVVVAIAAAVVGLTGCSDGDDRGSTSAPRPAVLDASVDATPVAAVVPASDPAAGYHLDDVATPPRPRRATTAPRIQRTLQLMLVSTPSGAIAAVDGQAVGRTPVYWEGDFTGVEREFTFVLSGYTIGRYRFVPLQNGFVHGTLQRVTADGDAGVPEIPMPELPEPMPAVPERRPAPRPAPITRPVEPAPPLTSTDAAPTSAPDDAGTEALEAPTDAAD